MSRTPRVARSARSRAALPRSRAGPAANEIVRPDHSPPMRVSIRAKSLTFSGRHGTTRRVTPISPLSYRSSTLSVVPMRGR